VDCAMLASMCPGSDEPPCVETCPAQQKAIFGAQDVDRCANRSDDFPEKQKKTSNRTSTREHDVIKPVNDRTMRSACGRALGVSGNVLAQPSPHVRLEAPAGTGRARR